MQTPLTARVLNSLLTAHDWTQDKLAKRCRVSPSVVTWHLSRRRPVLSNHLAVYLDALDAHERPILLAAWLRDSLGADVIRDVLHVEENRVREEVAAWSPSLTSEQRQMLNWWSAQLARDPELAEIFRRITLKAGYPKPWS